MLISDDGINFTGKNEDLNQGNGTQCVMKFYTITSTTFFSYYSHNSY